LKIRFIANLINWLFIHASPYEFKVLQKLWVETITSRNSDEGHHVWAPTSGNFCPTRHHLGQKSEKEEEEEEEEEEEYLSYIPVLGLTPQFLTSSVWYLERLFLCQVCIVPYQIQKIYIKPLLVLLKSLLCPQKYGQYQNTVHMLILGL
jgi:hypothetical protein